MDAESLNRPLFVEPTAEMEREDPWSGPQGFMLGGMALPTLDDLAEQYFDAASVLIGAVRRGEIEDYRLVNPVLFLYRHSLELQLKAVTGVTRKGHDLASLVGELDRLVQSRSGHPVPAWVVARLAELAALDPASTAFRYAETYDPATRLTRRVDGETYVDLRQLEAVMFALRTAMSRFP